MVVAFANAHNRLRNRFGVQVKMSDGHGLVLNSVIEEDGNAGGQALCKVCARPDVLDPPSALADERRSNEKYAAEPGYRGLLSQRVDQNGCPDRVAYEN